MDALVYLIEELPIGNGMPRDVRRDFHRILAESLARSGVLAVDSLTDEQAAPFGGYNALAAGYPELRAGLANEARAALRRCATGEHNG